MSSLLSGVGPASALAHLKLRFLPRPLNGSGSHSSQGLTHFTLLVPFPKSLCHTSKFLFQNVNRFSKETQIF
jgi:hypothetical protein